jgi:hypothetical protein
MLWPGSESARRAERRSSGKEYWPTAKTHPSALQEEAIIRWNKMTEVEKERAARGLDKPALDKAVYPGNMGFVEMYQLVRQAPANVSRAFLDLVNSGRHSEAIKIMEDFHHLKFNPSIYGKQLAPSKKDPTKRRWQNTFAAQMLGFDPEAGKRSLLKGKRMKHIIIQKANVDEYVRFRNGEPQMVKSHIRHVVTKERLAKGFRLANYSRTLGKNESRRAKKEKAESGDWTPHEERFRERAKERRESYGEVQPQ